MAETRPDNLPVWATDGGVTAEPAAGYKASGFSAGKKLPAKWLNWIMNTIYGWVNWFHYETISPTIMQNILFRSQTTATISGNNWSGVCWAPEIAKYIAVSTNSGFGDQVIESDDGTSWTEQTAAEANEWVQVCWAPSLTLAIAVARTGTNRVMTSPDATTWTARSAAAAKLWQDVVWSESLGIAVAVGYAGTFGSPSTDDNIMTSTNGTSWTSRTTPDDANFVSVAWAEELGLFLAGGVNSGGDDVVYRSSDGITWTDTSCTVLSDYLRGITWSGELGLACGCGASGTLYTSPDGITWTSRTATESATWGRVIWAQELGLFVAGSETATNPIMTSRDGITWTAREVDSSDANDVAWSPELSRLVWPSAGGDCGYTSL